MTVPGSRLQAFSFFHGLMPQQLEALAACAELISCEPRQYLFQQGGRAEAFYAIGSGLVALEIFTSQCRRIRVQSLHSGEMLGWSWLYPPFVWSFDALALSRVEALRFDARRVRALIEKDHEFGYQLQRRLTPLIISRLQATRLHLAEVVSLTAPPDDPTGEL